ncbi:MAG: hypothetical protein E7177_04535 [Erysipelotrichaceae bacterium]|nr:hypothetical protein [Erysipelotrichaceae bacterium]
MKNKGLKLFLLAAALLMSGCGNPGSSSENSSSEVSSSEVSSEESSSASSSEKTYENQITIAKALELAKAAGANGTSENYTVIGTIKEIKSYQYGDMTITDGTNELYIYGPRGADGYTYFDKLEETPSVGDEVVLYGKLKDYSGTLEMDHPAILDFTHVEVEFDDTAYVSKTIKQAREAKKGDKIKITGVVVRHTYATGMAKNGVYIADETGSIYVYGKDVANKVKEGNTVTIAGEKDYYILDAELTPAGKWGYTGCNQISNAYLIENDNLTTGNWNKTWVEEKTVKELMETPFTSDVTTNIYKTTALVKKVEGTGFTNYYIDDLDGTTGTYSYSQASGADYEWLDACDGKICTVYVSMHNAKSENKGCTWRFVPVAAEVDTTFSFDMATAPKFAYDYYLDGQLEGYYYEGRDAKLELINSIKNDVVNFDATVSYTSSNTEVATIEVNDGKTILHTNAIGKTTIKTIVSVSGQTSYEKEVEIEVQEVPEFTANTVQYAIESDKDTEVTLHGVVVASVVNQSGFYIQDNTGIITVLGAENMVSSLSIGDEIVIKGTRGNKIKSGINAPGQIVVNATELLVNFHGNNSYSTDKFITGKNLKYLYELNSSEDIHSTEVYVIQAKVVVIEEAYFTKINLQDDSSEFELYCSGANQYSFLKPYAGKTVTLEINPCNYNKTFYKGCVISVTDANGVKTINSLNFQNK